MAKKKKTGNKGLSPKDLARRNEAVKMARYFEMRKRL